MAHWHLAALNAWDKFEESEKKFESFTNIRQGPKGAFTDSLQRVTLVVNKIVSDSEVGKILIESLAFENVNSECRRMIRTLRVSANRVMD